MWVLSLSINSTPHCNPLKNEGTFLLIFDYVLLTLNLIFTAAAGYVINDIFDVEIDKINKPKKVLLATTQELKQGKKFYFILIAISVLLTIYLSFRQKSSIHLMYFIGLHGVLFTYSWKFQKYALFGNIITSVSIASITFISSYFFLKATQDINKDLSEYCSLNNLDSFIKFQFIPGLIFSYIFLLNFSREIIKDIEDIEGDAKLGLRTFPIKHGIKEAKALAVIAISILVIGTIIIFSNNQNYLAITLIVSLFFNILFILIADTKKRYSLSSLSIKITMIIGLIYLIFSYIL